MIAYDYEKQMWIEGEAAKPVLVKNLRSDLDMHTGPKRREYAEFVGLSYNDQQRRVADIRQQLRDLGEVV